MSGRARRTTDPPTAEPLIELRAVRKEHHGLRPLRVNHLELRRGQSLALLGFDAATAQVLVDLITGATLPDSGTITLFGRSTAAIDNPDEWLRTLDQVGLLTERVVLLDQLTAAQNLAIPFSLDVDNLDEDCQSGIERLAAEVGVDVTLPLPAGQLPASARLRIRLGRALALSPPLLLSEHPTAPLGGREAPEFAIDLARIVKARHLGSLLLTADRQLAATVADQVFQLQPATGELRQVNGWRRWFS